MVTTVNIKNFVAKFTMEISMTETLGGRTKMYSHTDNSPKVMFSEKGA